MYNLWIISKIKIYPEGYFLKILMGLGIAILSGFGIPIGIITNN
jgi:hypothetical protein